MPLRRTRRNGTFITMTRNHLQNLNLRRIERLFSLSLGSLRRTLIQIDRELIFTPAPFRVTRKKARDIIQMTEYLGLVESILLDAQDRINELDVTTSEESSTEAEEYISSTIA